MAGIFSKSTIDISSGQSFVYFTPLSWHPTGSKPAILYAHGRGGTARDFFDPSVYAKLKAFTDAGYPLVANDLGGTTNYGNDTAITRLGQTRTFAQGPQIGAKSGKVVLFSVSMGGLAVCNWARQNKSLVSCIVMTVPATELQYYHDNDILEGVDAEAEIDAAYGGHTNYVNSLATHSPLNYAAEIADLPIAIFYNTDDNMASPARIEAFGAAVGASMFPSLGLHTLDNINMTQLISFIDTHTA